MARAGWGRWLGVTLQLYANEAAACGGNNRTHRDICLHLQTGGADGWCPNTALQIRSHSRPVGGAILKILICRAESSESAALFPVGGLGR